jgi:hypothetical protein
MKIYELRRRKNFKKHPNIRRFVLRAMALPTL